MSSKKKDLKKKLKAAERELKQQKKATKESQRELKDQLAHAEETSQQLAQRPRAQAKVKIPQRHHQMRAESITPISATLISVVLTPATDNIRPVSEDLVEEYVRVLIPPHDVDGSVKTPSTVRETDKGVLPFWDEAKPASRKYSVRRFWPETGAIELYVTRHQRGPGTEWAEDLQPGDTVWIQGVKSGLKISNDYDFYLMITDDSGLGSTLRWIDLLPPNAQGALFVLTSGPDAVFELDLPTGFSITWAYPTHPDEALEAPENNKALNELVDKVTSLPRPQGYVFGWLVGESSLVRPLREFIRSGWELSKADSYVHGYWKAKGEPPYRLVADYSRLSKAELYVYAQQRDLPQRSALNKAQLIEALRADQRGQDPTEVQQADPSDAAVDDHAVSGN
ncbi:siderophore-interacting protein [Auritidibacter ignavus]|uniref:siderophore-interacting protein n=1 Tax=Auritidibacter ignavus TaxID=678932 RepID=UPI000F033DEC|nr:siderophore-interacting protein [Auritidibacter ignavus]NIH71209.1 NADPH-dependent ferric siderophore reductase [Auritidibacter ignavus]RMX22769.1 siderophore-interacting protein [Auritidibacter ignavus]WGH83589.1 siderophore-interacting protein [Auritidibacter ignavus]WGH85369.1 siderophore-interacting protein [Auritidibacter ignavus]WGH87656.1 siderophore-interacting protein [Auritidibacter ignavus]